MFSTTYRVNVFDRCPETCRNLFLSAPLYGRFAWFVKSGTHDFEVRMLVMHRNPHIFVPHCLHYCCEIPGTCQYPGTEVVPTTIQHQFFREISLCTRRPKSVCYVHQMAAFRAFGWKQPSFPLSTCAGSQQLVYAVTHRDHSSAIRSLTVRYKDDPVLPVEVLSTDSVKLPAIPHP